MNREEALAYLKQNHNGVLATLKKDGRPQLSNILYLYDADGKIKISTTSDRFKARNIQRDSRVSMEVIGENFYQYLVVEGQATLSPEGELDELRRIYKAISGKEHPNWQEYDQAMLNEHRVVISIEIEKMYPLEQG
ncbi:MAG TPA: PPOX class F420-dependent oxidoreductase [Chloroflexia bacterium]|nr:PPOX class F420-dependent oxidoreductase [Chloroflexia bacterium]